MKNKQIENWEKEKREKEKREKENNGGGDDGNGNNLKNKQSNNIKIELKKYYAARAVIGYIKYVLQGLFLLFLVFVGYIIYEAEGISQIMLWSLLSVTCVFVFLYAMIQLFEAVFDISNNTNQTNILLQKLINKKE